MSISAFPCNGFLKKIKAPELKIEQMHYEVLGEKNKEVLVLIHGLDSAAPTFYNVTEELAKKYKVVVYDQRGHGRTAAVGKNYSNEVMAQDLKNLLNHLGIEKANILGHSMGGRTALKFADLYPGNVERLIIEDIDAGLRRPLDEKKLDDIIKYHEELAKLPRNYATREDFINTFKKYYGAEAESLSYRRTKQLEDGSLELLWRPEITPLYGAMGNSDDLIPGIKNKKFPILFMQADPTKGAALSDEGVEELIERMPYVKYHLFKGAGHTIHRADEQAFLKVLRSFLNDDFSGRLPLPAVFRRIFKSPGNQSAISYKGTTFPNTYVFDNVHSQNMIPLGSALSTPAGDLEKTGIRQIIHAASGSSAQYKAKDLTEPTLSSVYGSVMNSLELARAGGHKRVALPFIGGGIFAKRIGTTNEELAKAIVSSASRNGNDLEVVFVLFSDEEVELFKNLVAKRRNTNLHVVKGSITDYEVHKASAIVNAANMEVTFGGGVSGVIGKASGQIDEINEIALRTIKEFAESEDPYKKSAAFIRNEQERIFKKVVINKDYQITEARITELKNQVDQTKLEETLFVIPANDGEAVRAHQILHSLEAPYVILSRQGWGATLDKEKLPKGLLDKVKNVAVFEMPHLQTEEKLKGFGKNVIIFDHHAYKVVDRRADKSSLQQLMDYLNLKMDKVDNIIATNDHSYIPGLKEIGLTKEEIYKIRKYDRLSQGHPLKLVEETMEDAVKQVALVKAGRASKVLSFKDGIYILHEGGDKGTILAELNIQAVKGEIVNLFELRNGGVGFSGSPKVVKKLYNTNFEEFGYESKDILKYIYGDDKHAMSFRFRPQKPPRGFTELLPKSLEYFIWKMITQEL
jgi:esterase